MFPAPISAFLVSKTSREATCGSRSWYGSRLSRTFRPAPVPRKFEQEPALWHLWIICPVESVCREIGTLFHWGATIPPGRIFPWGEVDLTGVCQTCPGIWCPSALAMCAYLNCPFCPQKTHFRANISPLFDIISFNISDLAWPDPIS